MNKHYLLILTLGVFSILNTEMGVIGILPMIAAQYEVDIATAGLLVSVFALAIAIAGPIMPLLFSRFERKKVMLLVLSIFTVCNILAALATNFTMLLITRAVPAFFHPVYVSLAFAAAADSAERAADIPKAVSKVMMGVSAGMVLGAPVAGVIVNWSSLQSGMLFFAFINILALVATIFFVPELQVNKRVSYADQLGVLKKGSLWTAIVGVIFLNGSIFGVYSYMAAYLQEVTRLPMGFISGLLFIYGLMNVVGNNIAGKALANNANRLIVLFPILMTVTYCSMLLLGSFTIPTAAIILFWGILAGAGGSINQYWITSAAPEAPEFANGLFLTASNLGLTLATLLGGMFITNFGINSIWLSGIFFLVGCALLIFVKIKIVDYNNIHKNLAAVLD